MEVNKELDKLSLLQRKSTTTIEYLQQLISGLENEKPPNYIERVGELKSTIKMI